VALRYLAESKGFLKPKRKKKVREKGTGSQAVEDKYIVHYNTRKMPQIVSYHHFLSANMSLL
jgi:hypothetical protein